MNVNDLRAKLTNIQMSLKFKKEQIRFTNAKIRLDGSRGNELKVDLEVDYDGDNNEVLLRGRG